MGCFAWPFSRGLFLRGLFCVGFLRGLFCVGFFASAFFAWAFWRGLLRGLFLRGLFCVGLNFDVL